MREVNGLERRDRHTAGQIADRLVATVVQGMEQLVASTAPGLTLPRLYGGHPVGDNVSADLLYVLGLLGEAGTSELAGVSLEAKIPALLANLDPDQIQGFYSYRVADTVMRTGGVERLPQEARSRLFEKVRSPALIAGLGDSNSDFNTNYKIVSARCLYAAHRLGDVSSADLLAKSLTEVENLFAGSVTGWLNDGRRGQDQYDIYTPDMYLLAAPMADRLSGAWRNGFQKVVADLDDLVQPNGAIVWGRSIGVLAQALSVQVASATVGWELSRHPDRWLARIPEVLDDLRGWFDKGVTTAHRGRATDPYRGPARRLQLTFDIYGKLLEAASWLREKPNVMAGDPGDAWYPVDRLVPFDENGSAAVWSYRSHDISFALPVMLGFSSDYLPSPRWPGFLEQPTCGHPTMLPTVMRVGESTTTGHSVRAWSLVPAGRPTFMEHSRGQLRLRYDGWAPVGKSAAGPEGLGGSRSVTFAVRGRSLVVSEDLRFVDGGLPGPLTLTVPARDSRALEFDVSGDAQIIQIDTSGLPEWRSCWGELQKVEQVELVPATRVHLTWRVAPGLRVASTNFGHWYHNLLYAPLEEQITVVDAGPVDNGLARRLRDVDVLHLAWPEKWSGVDPGRTREVIELIKASGTRIVWTQHNLLPHASRGDLARRTYAMWASAADGVIHHSDYGMRKALSTYSYRADARHAVIPHGHWGSRYDPYRGAARRTIEREEGWGAWPIRLALIGDPRPHRKSQQ